MTVFQEIWGTALAEGEAGGKIALLHHQLVAKFGRLPKWARTRLENADPLQVHYWAIKVLTADTLEETLGKRARLTQPFPAAGCGVFRSSNKSSAQ